MTVTSERSQVSNRLTQMIVRKEMILKDILCLSKTLEMCGDESAPQNVYYIISWTRGGRGYVDGSGEK